MHEWQCLSHVRWECKYHVVIIPVKASSRIWAVICIGLTSRPLVLTCAATHDESGSAGACRSSWSSAVHDGDEKDPFAGIVERLVEAREVQRGTTVKQVLDQIN
jgi:hypothetical protein